MSLTVAALLLQARAAGVDRLDAQLLLAHLLQRPRTWLISHDDVIVDTGLPAAFSALVAERARGVPLAYLVGTREFHGLLLQVTADVLVPRPDSETLVNEALQRLAVNDRAVHRTDRPTLVADLGTGSGAIALAIKAARPLVQVVATDFSAAALDVARGNAQRLALVIDFLQGDWFGAFAADQRFDMIVSNPPYIDAEDPHLLALHAEPRSALTPGRDGLAALRIIVAQAPAHLHPGGWLLLEHGHSQGPALRSLLLGHGFSEVGSARDLAGQERVSVGQRA